jgi:hypothetical protein
MLSDFRFYTIFLFVFQSVKCEFTADFVNFLEQRYGREMALSLQRLDMGLLNVGSFGGKIDASENITNRASFLD